MDIPVHLPKRRVLTADISLGSFQDQINTMVDLGAAHRSSYVCCVNAHMSVEAHNDPAFAAVVNKADLATADGMPMLNSAEQHSTRSESRTRGWERHHASRLDIEAEREGLVASSSMVATAEVLDRMIAKAAREEFPGCASAGTSRALPVR